MTKQRRIQQYVRNHWQFIAGTTIGLLGIYLSYLFYLESIKSREPVFLVDPLQYEIVSREPLSHSPIRVLRADGSELQSNVYIARFYFWNRGKESIRRSNILEPLRVVLSDTSARLLHYYIFARSRSLTEFFVQADSTYNHRTLQIDFSILDNNDGASCQVFYECPSQSNLKLTGAIEGVNELLENPSTPITSILFAIIKYLFIGLSGILILVLIITFFSYVDKLFLFLMNKLFGKTGLRVGNFISNIVGGAIILLILYVMISNSIKPDIEERVTSIHDVPQSILSR